MEHEKIISLLDQAGQTFRVLIVKTNMTLPYTSVFLQLDCGYWSADAEQRLRKAMAARNRNERGRGVLDVRFRAGSYRLSRGLQLGPDLVEHLLVATLLPRTKQLSSSPSQISPLTGNTPLL